MDFENVRTLLKKYSDAETSVEEEHMLRCFFAGARNLPDDLKMYAPLFQYFDLEKNRTLEPAAPVRRIKPRLRLLKYAAGAAAISITVLMINHSEKTGASVADSFDDPKRAIAETKKVLLLLSKNLNDGTAKASTISVFDELKNSEKFKSLERNKKINR